MNKFNLQDFLARSTDKPYEETTLAMALGELPYLSKQGPWVAGGALRRTLLGQEPESDFDLFFRDKDQLADCKTLLESMGFTQRKETEHHVHFTGMLAGKERDVQLIRFAYYAIAQEVIESFDFTICQFAFDGETLYCGDYALWDLGRKRLAINKITFPLSTMRRVLKYTRQGFNACPGCLTAILTATSNNPQLMEQLNTHYVD